LTDDAMRLLLRYTWPGNIRELENEVERMYALSSDRITTEHLSPGVIEGRNRDGTTGGQAGVGGAATSTSVLDTLDLRELVQRETESIERRAIAEALRRSKWKKTEAASMLGISRPTLDAKIE